MRTLKVGDTPKPGKAYAIHPERVELAAEAAAEATRALGLAVKAEKKGKVALADRLLAKATAADARHTEAV